MRSLCVSRENIFSKHPLYLISTIKMSPCPLKAGVEISFGKKCDFCCFPAGTLIYRELRGEVQKTLDISENPAKVKISRTVTSVSAPIGEIERTDNCVITDEDTSRQTKFAERRLLIDLPYIAGL